MGFDLFVKTVSQEILRRNPKLSHNSDEVTRIVQAEWDSMKPEQRQMYHKIAEQNSLAASLIEHK